MGRSGPVKTAVDETAGTSDGGKLSPYECVIPAGAKRRAGISQ